MSFSVAARVRGPQPVEGTTINPFQALNTMSEIQARQQNMQQQQREMLAQQRSGAILAQAPTLQDGINAIASDPFTAPYSSEMIQRYQSALQTQREINVSVSHEAQDLHTAVLNSAFSTDDPAIAKQLMLQRFSLATPEAQRTEAPAFNSVVESLTGGMDGMTPDQQSMEMQKRRAAIGVSLKIDPDYIRNVNGIPKPYSQEGVDPVTGRPITMQVQTPLYAGGVAAPPQAVSSITGMPEPISAWPQPAPTPTPTPAPAPTTTPGTGGTLTTGGAVSPGGAPSTGGVPAPGGATMTTPTTSPTGGAPDSLVPPPPGSGGLAPGFTRAPMGAYTLQEQKEMEATVARNSEMYKNELGQINDAGATIGNLSEKMDFIQDMMRGFQGGPGTSLRTEGAAALRSMGSLVGMDPSKMNTLANQFLGGSSMEALADEQDFKALISSYAVQQLKEAALGTGRVMLPEVQTFMDSISPDMDPLAIMRLINRQGRFGLQVGMDRINKFNGFVSGVRSGTLRDPQGHPYDIGNYLGWYSQNMPKTEKLPIVNQGGRYIGPRPEWDYYGGKPPQGGYRVDPATNNLVPN